MTNELHRARLESTKPNEEILNRRLGLARVFRSGTYLKGTKILRNLANCFCPLGVLADVHHQETKRGEWTRDDVSWQFDKSRYFPSAEAAAYFGLNRYGTFYVPNDANMHTWPEMNDERGWEFTDFANLLEDPRIVWVPENVRVA